MPKPSPFRLLLPYLSNRKGVVGDMNADVERLKTARLLVGHVQKRCKEYAFSCICPNCNQPSIKSHSQQKERQLRAIAKDGCVYALDRNFYHHLKGYEQSDYLNMNVIGIGEASTFQGYCNIHDKMIFSPIERESLVQNRADQATLLLLRAISYEFARKRDASIFKDELFLTEINSYALPEEIELFLNYAFGVDLYLQRESPFYFQRIFSIICNSAYDLVKTSWVTIDHVLPISTATVFCPWMDTYEERWCWDKPQPLVSFTIAPVNGVTHIVVSWLIEHNDDACWIENKMHSICGLEEIINLCIFESEDCCFNIDFWDGLSHETRSTVMSNLRPDSHRGSIQELPHIVTLT